MDSTGLGFDNIILDKINNADPNTFVFFYLKQCPYCYQTLDLLRNSTYPYKGYNIYKIDGQMPRLLQIFNRNASVLNFPATYNTMPLIFINGKFLGGYNELNQYLGRPWY